MLTKYHHQILSEGLAERFSVRAFSAIVTANNHQDRLSGLLFHDEYHVDNSAFQQANDYLEGQRSLTISSLKANDAKAAWAAFGRLTHTVHDFYAHSNYIDLWLARFNDGRQFPSNSPSTPAEIDPVDPSLLHHSELHSGKVYYPLELFYFVKPLRKFALKFIPRDSHAWMNLDSPEQGFKFDYAMQAAIKRTKIEFDKTTLGFSDEMCRLFLDK
ncbi:MAG TPA: hypothetical protein VFQ23_21895 [Anaerolineales bacterium]|nr:hypothetical protein [Anaerolineales bacterium]